MTVPISPIQIDLFQGIPPVDFSLVHYLPDTLDHGRKVSGGIDTTETVEGIITPAQPNDLYILEEGKRTRKSIVVWVKFTNAPSSLSEATSTPADHIIFDGEEYEVQQVDKWDNLNLQYYKILAQRLEVTG